VGENDMDPMWGALFIVIGLFMLISSLSKSDFIIYRLLVARSQLMWGDNVHRFYHIVGIVLIGIGVLVVLGILW
jgi:hypothetical protein